MVFQDWVIPIVISALILDFGMVWALRLRNRAQSMDRIPSDETLSSDGDTSTSQHMRTSQSTGAAILKSGGLKPTIRNLAGELRITSFQGILLVGAMLLALAAAVSTVQDDFPFSQSVATLCWGVSVVLTILGGGHRGDLTWRPSWKSVLWLTLLTAIAFLLRGTATSHVPVALTGDEGAFGRQAYQFQSGLINNLFSTGVYSFPALFSFIQSFSIGILGPTSQAIRIPSAIIGAFTVGGVYLMGKTMFGHRTGLFAGIFLALFHFHIHFSRLGLNNVWDGMWYVLALGAFWKGWQTQKRSAFLLSGLGLGLAQYFYASSRVLPLILLVWLFLLALTDKHRFRRILPDLTLLFFTAFIIALPLLFFYVHNPDIFIAPLHRIRIFGPWLDATMEISQLPAWKIILNQLKLGFLAYVSVPVGFFYEPYTPLLRPPTALLFILGLVFILGQIRKPQNQLFIIWLTAIALLGAFSIPTPSAQRYLAAAPACALVIAMALNGLLDWFRKHLVQASLLLRSVLLVGFCLIMILIMIDDASFYFMRYIPLNYRQWTHAYRDHLLAEQLIEIPGEWELVLVDTDHTQLLSNPVITYLIPGIGKIQKWVLDDLVRESQQAHRLIFIFLPEEKDELETVQNQFPGGHLFDQRGQRNVIGTTLYWLYDYTP